MIDEAAIRLRWERVGARLDERGRRLFAAAEVRSAGRGGLALVSKITGLARSTINRGEDDLDGEPLAKGRVRRAGGGRRSVSEADPGLVPALKRLVEPATLGDPMRPLMWVSKAGEAGGGADRDGTSDQRRYGRHGVGELGFSRQSNRRRMKARTIPTATPSSTHQREVVAAQAGQQPVISVDTKRGVARQLQDGGTDYRPKASAAGERADFEDKKLGKVVPYGVYDVTANAGFVSVGITSDTAEFAVASIRCWLDAGTKRYPQARELTITADCGGSMGRACGWKLDCKSSPTRPACDPRPPLSARPSKWTGSSPPVLPHHADWRGRPLTDRLAVVD